MNDWGKNEKFVIEKLNSISAQSEKNQTLLAESAVKRAEMEARLKENIAESEARLLAAMNKKALSLESLKTKVALYSGGVSMLMAGAVATIFRLFFSGS